MKNSPGGGGRSVRPPRGHLIQLLVFTLSGHEVEVSLLARILGRAVLIAARASIEDVAFGQDDELGVLPLLALDLDAHAHLASLGKGGRDELAIGRGGDGEEVLGRSLPLAADADIANEVYVRLLEVDGVL